MKDIDYKRLEKRLKRYGSNEFAVPDYWFEAYRILILQETLPNKKLILEQALKDLDEEEHSKNNKNFNDNRRKMDNITGAVWNWGSQQDSFYRGK